MTAESTRYPLLAAVDSPADLRALDVEQLPALAAELRRYLVENLSHGGCHFAANLGTVELAIALHYVYDTPNDRLVWDVGHQAYPHKILTGRRDALRTIRQRGGLAPFPTRDESHYDTFGVGHSSTSIGGALGMAIGAALRGEDRRAVAIIGDGAMTAGMAYEALNHAGALNADLLVVFNDNDMSISPNVGALSNYLAKMLSGKLYANLREGSKKVLSLMPTVWELARRFIHIVQRDREFDGAEVRGEMAAAVAQVLDEILAQFGGERRQSIHVQRPQVGGAVDCGEQRILRGIGGHCGSVVGKPCIISV